MSELERVAHTRAQLVSAARRLAEAGVPADVIVDDAREGIARAAAARSRSGR